MRLYFAVDVVLVSKRICNKSRNCGLHASLSISDWTVLDVAEAISIGAKEYD